jgi:chemotaxis protein CheY-P-specific phosphatase CheC
VPSVPALAIDMPEAIFETVSAEMAESGGEALLIENEIVETATKIGTSFYLIPDKDAMVRILEALNNTIKGV